MKQSEVRLLSDDTKEKEGGDITNSVEQVKVAEIKLKTLKDFWAHLESETLSLSLEKLKLAKEIMPSKYKK
eukprot:11075686-Ditylum_brightwellii.AAC.1